jgi:AmmeMemoRadiSam system protein A
MTAPEVLPALTLDEQRSLLAVAREAIVAASANRSSPQPDLQSLPPALARPTACFVTIRSGDTLRGCTGTLVAERPLALDVWRCAIQTATSDPRFDPIRTDELDVIEIEVSVLTQPQALQVDDPAGLPELIRPGVDGLTLYHGARRATFLPQVWERIQEPVNFLDMLCRKMGLSEGAWRLPGMTAEIYQTFSFSEADFEQP